MMSIMRTTVNISDELLVAAKRRAHSAGRPLGWVIDTALRRELAARRSIGERPQVPVFHGGTGPRPGVDLTSNQALAEALDGDLPVDDRR